MFGLTAEIYAWYVVYRCLCPTFFGFKRESVTSNNVETTSSYKCSSMYVCMVITYSKSMDQPGKVANPARDQLNREN